MGEVLITKNPLQARSANRPNVPGPVVTKAQDTPDEWRKGRLVEFIRRVAAALQAHLASDPVPVVLVADAETGDTSRSSPRSAPCSPTSSRQTPRIWTRRRCTRPPTPSCGRASTADREAAVERFQACPEAATRAATRTEGGSGRPTRAASARCCSPRTRPVWGRYDEAADEVATGARFAQTGQDLLDAAAVRTLRHGGTVHVPPWGKSPRTCSWPRPCAIDLMACPERA